MTELLTDDQVQQALGGLDGWRQDRRELVRVVELADFPTAIVVVDRVAEAAEAADHHPDIDIRWRTLTFRLSTHSEGGLTAKDVELAGRIDAIVSAQPLA
ncbi:MAG TPA: 4a-hydroxytetrahydrobiopterin dehydratase [Pseudonocardiaceae bacterium]|jgi:4a-hydroxytetrahydrobiopterin dehydratase|nr:4a-hydroxytetrahydrobiopterin dehydratase [Pseudonocardiaceae bacterium]